MATLTVNVSVLIDKETAEWIEDLANSNRVSKGVILRELIRLGRENYNRRQILRS